MKHVVKHISYIAMQYLWNLLHCLRLIVCKMDFTSMKYILLYSMPVPAGEECMSYAECFFSGIGERWVKECYLASLGGVDG